MKIEDVSKLKDAGKIIADEECNKNGEGGKHGLADNTIIKVIIGERDITPIEIYHNNSGKSKFSWTLN